jgi:ribosomal protein S12 methylthiotransferase accessory factor
MFLEQENKNMVTVETTSISLPLDKSLEAIAHFISDRLKARHRDAQVTQLPPVVISLSFLGIPGKDYQMPTPEDTRSVYPIRVHYSSILLGPLYNPHRAGGPCPRCLERRWLANRSKEEQQAVQKAQNVFATGPHPKLHLSVLESLWLIIEDALDAACRRAQSEDGSGQFYSLRLDTLELQRHQLLADSSCPCCAEQAPHEVEVARPLLLPRPKPNSSSYRLVNPLDYHLPAAGYVNHQCSALGTWAKPDLFHSITSPVTGSYHLQGRTSINHVGWGGHSTNFAASERIGILEGLERYCGHWSRTQAPTIIDSYHNLSSDALDPRMCGLYHPNTYQKALRMVPFDPDVKIAWVWGYSLRQQRPLLVPEQLVYYFAQTENDPAFVNDTSNGCAIGSCLDEAILFGLLELVERDNFLIHWYAKLAAPRIDPWSSQSEKTLQLLDRIERLGCDIHLLDTRLDLPFPTVTAVAVRRNGGLGAFAVAAGAGIEPEDAIRSALCELAAYIPSMPERVIGDLENLRQLAKDYSKVRTIEHHTLLYGLPEMARQAEFLYQNPAVRSVEAVYAQWNEQRPRNWDLREDLRYSIEQLGALDIDCIVVDQTAPELQGTGLKVVRVLAPGLVPIDFGWDRHRIFGLPRMRTAPLAAGYPETAFNLSALNFAPHPFP